MAKKNALGRGLGALIENSEEEDKKVVEEKLVEANSMIPVERIEVNPFQPRSHFDEEALHELAESIKQIGIVQPLTVTAEDGKFILVAGERRLRAAKIAGLTEVPAYIRVVDDKALLELALVENIQREDLDAIEIAISYQRLIEEHDLTQENLSQRVGKKRATITNYLRLLKLPAEVQLGIRQKKIAMGHARALLGLEKEEDQVSAYYKILDEDLSVRATEQYVREILNPPEPVNNKPSNQEDSSEEYHELKNHLDQFFKTKVDFKRNNKGQGKITIPFKSDEELERIIAILDKK
jgi:ParB family chromosome partitioning protein